MRIIGRRILREFCETHPDTSNALQTWFNDVESAIWNSPEDIKMVYRNARFMANDRVVFDIKGHHYRLVVVVAYQHSLVFIRIVGTHELHDRIEIPTV